MDQIRPRLRVLREGGLPAIRFRFRGRTKHYRGSSLGNHPTWRDSFIRLLAAKFRDEVLAQS